jgi:predicted RNA methylase
MSLPGKIRRRFQKAVLQHGVLKTIGLTMVWPIMFAKWRLMEQTPFERQRTRAGEEYDRLHNVDTIRTRGNEWVADVKSENWAQGTGYGVSPPETVRRAIEMLPIDDITEYVFIDMGSGKCRVPLVASEYPFKECIGVEYDPALHETAVKNIASFTCDKQKCKAVSAHCHDAVTYPIPPSPIVMYFGHPFGGKVLDGLLQNLKRSMQQHPRPVYVIYYDPICGDQYESYGFREIASYDLPRINRFHNKRGKEFAIYLNDSICS